MQKKQQTLDCFIHWSSIPFKVLNSDKVGQIANQRKETEDNRLAITKQKSSGITCCQTRWEAQREKHTQTLSPYVLFQLNKGDISIKLWNSQGWAICCPSIEQSAWHCLPFCFVMALAKSLFSFKRYSGQGFLWRQELYHRTVLQH